MQNAFTESEGLADAGRTAGIVKKYEFEFSKRFGQNFLIDSHVLDKIIAAAEITPEDYILEIGPGIGTMTQALAKSAGHVTAVEIDTRLIPILEENLKDYRNVDIINEDVLKLDLPALVRERNAGRPIKVVANLPYYITTPIIMGLFESGVPLISITVMVQKEVADRMKAGPGSKDYGALSLACQYYSKPYLAANVPANCFMPRPKVGSAVIKLTRLTAPPVETADRQFMFDIIAASFEQRRKTLQNSLGNSAKVNVSKEAVRLALEEMGLPETVRGEALSLSQFARLSSLLFK